MTLSEPQHECWGIEKRRMSQPSGCGAENHPAAKMCELMG